MDEQIGPNTQNQGSFVTPLLISLAGLVGTTLAVVAYHLLLFKYCIGRRSRRRSGFIDSAIQAGGPIGIGVEQHVLDAIPIFIFSKDQLSENFEQIECVICLGELEEGDMARLLPSCGHVFHVACIDDWFMAHTSCPICRSPIEETNEENIEKITIHDEDLAQFLEQREQEESGEASSSRQEGSIKHNLLRHSVSLVLPMEGNKFKGVLKLKRSLSMDHSFVAIDMQRESDDQKNGDATCSNSSSLKGDLMESRSYGTLSMKQLDRMSLMLLRSFSQMRIGRGVPNGGVVLPR